jgi:hypothetical protein
MKLASRGSSILCEILSQPQSEPDELRDSLNQSFSNQNFHCAHSVVMLASEELKVPPLPPNMLIPLDGGIGYSGSTCAAMLGGCLAIGLVKGGDTSEGGTFGFVMRLALTLIQGGKAFNRLDLSPANDALLRCAELSKWFDKKFGSRICRDIIKTDFHNQRSALEFFDRKIISKCIGMAKETAAKAAELAR